MSAKPEHLLVNSGWSCLKLSSLLQGPGPSSPNIVSIVNPHLSRHNGFYIVDSFYNRVSRRDFVSLIGGQCIVDILFVIVVIKFIRILVKSVSFSLRHVSHQCESEG